MAYSKIVSTIVTVAMLGLAACGGGGSAAPAETGTTGADVSKLTSLPTTDLSAYDTTQSSSSSNISVTLQAVGKSLTAKEIPGAQGAGKLCRACCEAYMHKKQIFRSSALAQQMRCVAEAFQSAGLITAGTNDFNIYSITPPEEKAEETAKMCDDIPAERTEERAACQTGNEGAEGGILMRLGVFGGNELRVDICKVKPTPALEDESSYSLSGGTATTNVVHIGTWGGHTEKMSLSSTIAGMTGINSDTLVPTLDSTSGSAEATASMDGGFGSGTISFKRMESDKSIIVSGTFAGKFKEPSSGVETSFTGKTYAQGGGTGNTVAAKFSFTGAPPPMKLSKMIPFDIPTSQLANFLQVMSTQFGFAITADNYQSLFVCPNAAFDPANPSAAVKPMILVASGAACPTMTHTGIECGTITNGTEDSAFSGKKTTQTFTTLDCNDASVKTFYTAVNAFDLSTLTSSGSIAFLRNWDCSGTATPLDFSKLTQAQGLTLATYIQKCFALEEKNRGNDGMGEYDCSGKDSANAVNDIKKAPPSTGAIGGPYTKTAGGTCSGAGMPTPDKFFINNNGGTSYCLPDNVGGCGAFTYDPSAGASASNLNLNFTQGSATIKITNLTFSGGQTPTGVTVTWTTGSGSCTQTYTKDTVSGFTAPTAPSKPAEFPTECQAKGLTTPESCGDYCQHNTCTPPS